MAFTELTEVLSALNSGTLQSSVQRAELVERLQELQAVFLRLGASAPAVQLDLAAQLLRSFGEGDGVAECLSIVRRMVAPVEQAFQIQAHAPEAPRAPARETTTTPPVTRRYLKARLCVARDMLLGEMLVHFGVVEPEAIAAALAEKQHSKKRLGEILVQQGSTTAEEIQRALDYQARVRCGELGSPEDRPAAEAATVAATVKASERVAERASEKKTPETKAPEKKAPEKKAPEKRTPESKHVEPKPEPALPRTERSAPLRMTSSLLLGEILFMQGAVTREGLGRGMAEQRRSGRMLGEILSELGLVSRRQLEFALSFQGKGRQRSSARRAA